MKDLIKHVWQRIKCRLGRHELGDSIRLPGETFWHLHQFNAPVTNEKIICFRREFDVSQMCIHCCHEIISEGYDQKPIVSDEEFDKTHKNASNSRGLHLTEQEYEKHVRKLPKQNP